MVKQKKIEPLTGEELLHKVKKLGNLSKEEKAKTCGYYSITRDGLERVKMMQFLNALIDAEGIVLDGTGRNSEHEEPRASGQIAVRSNKSIDSNEIIAIKRANKPIPKPKPSSQPVQPLGDQQPEVQQLEIEQKEQPEVQQLEIEQKEQPEPVRHLESLAEPSREESVFGSGWSVTELMSEFSARYSG